MKRMACVAVLLGVCSLSGWAATSTLPLDYPKGGEFFDIGSTQKVVLGAKVKLNQVVTVDLSRDGGSTFTTLGPITVSKTVTSLSFTVTAPPSGNCVIRVSTPVKGVTESTLSGVFAIGKVGSGAAAAGDVNVANGSGGSSYAPASTVVTGTLEAVSVYASTSQLLNLVGTLNFDSEDYDTDALHDNVTNNSRLTCKVAGTYLVTAWCAMDGVAAGAARYLILMKNGNRVAYTSTPAISTEQTGLSLSFQLALAPGDYMELQGICNTVAGNTIVNSDDHPRFQMTRLP